MFTGSVVTVDPLRLTQSFYFFSGADGTAPETDLCSVISVNKQAHLLTCATKINKVPPSIIQVF